MIRIICWLILIRINSGARLLNCAVSDVRFQKVLGVRPDNSSQVSLLYRLPKSVPFRPVTAECIAKCQSDDNCQSFVLLYNRSECYSYGSSVSTDDANYVPDENVGWFSKMCTYGNTCDKLWVIERIPGATLIGNDTKILPGIFTRTECQQYCLNETEFFCRSAKFKVTINSFGIRTNRKGSCILSSTDRHLLPSAYRVSGYDDEYFENQCLLPPAANASQANEFCSYEEYDNVTLAHSDVLFERKSKQDCEELCEEFKNFNCRGYSITTDNKCYLHSEDSKIYGPTLLKQNFLSTYYEKARCLNISVMCSETYITINYEPELNFFGKIYMQGYSENPQCFATGQGYGRQVIMKIPLLTGTCGIIKANGPLNRTLLSGVLTIQYSPLIQTQSDRIIRVGCIFGNNTKVIVGTGVTISSSTPNRGSTLVSNASTVTVSPVVEMRIIDLSTHQEVSDTQIGQEVQLIITMQKIPNMSYDIWASHLIAMTEKGDESVFLLDDRGCPTNLNIFPPLEKFITSTSIMLVGNFQAFKFASSPIVRFSVIIQFCINECPVIKCEHNITSYGRRKREVASFTLQTINGTRVVEANRSKFEERSLINEMPLEYIMVVRDPKSISDRLVYGENSRILVAGYDYITDEVCMEYSLVIGLIVLWMFIQIFFIVGCIVLVRRYKRYYQHECMRQSLEELHKNFGIGFSNLENRRVHWADHENIM